MPQTEKKGLARFLNLPGGITAQDAQARAGLRLEAMKDVVTRKLEESVDCMGAYLGLLRGAPPNAVRGELRRLAYDLASISGSFDREGLGAAARSTCELLDALEQRNSWDRLAVDVHFDAMRALLHQPSDEAAAKVAEGLRRVAARVEQS